MAKIDVTVSVEKETYEVGKLLADVVLALKAKKGLAEIAASELPALMAAIDGIALVPTEFADDAGAFLSAALIPVSQALGALLKKDPAAAPAAPVA